jgi:two-component system NtrC family sensor kinase
MTLKKKSPISTKSKRKTVPRDQSSLLSFVEELKRKWMATIDAMIDPLLIVGTDFKIRKSNRAMADFAGISVKKLVGMKCHEVFARSKTPCRGCSMLKAANSGKAQSWSYDDKRGTKFWEISSQPIFAPDGRMDGVVQIYRDRTEARQLQEQLQQNEKMASIGLLAGGVAHEINNPLGGILIFSQMLLREMPKDSPHYQDVQEIEAATIRCKSIVENLLDFARQRPAKPGQLEDVDPCDAARTALRFSKVAMKGKRIEIVEKWNSEGSTVRADRNKLIQVFLNLIQNAVQAMPGGGTLTLASRLVEADLQLSVTDTGVGIPAANIKKIFDPFFTTKDPGEGTGLGLAICYGIVTDLGGKLTVESKVNKGTRFVVQLKVASAEEKASA